MNTNNLLTLAVISFVVVLAACAGFSTNPMNPEEAIKTIDEVAKIARKAVKEETSTWIDVVKNVGLPLGAILIDRAQQRARGVVRVKKPKVGATPIAPSTIDKP